jgi:adenosylmethionine-8-amino-7-oxononanoate aminotransferase
MRKDSWIRKDLAYIWHPYTQMKDCQTLPPILIEKAKGAKLYDGEGNFYYDTISSWWCKTFGHNHPRLKKALKKQLQFLEHTLFAGFTHRQAILLAEKLVSLTSPNLCKVFFSDNGSTSVEVALKMSFQYWHNIGEKRRKKFVCLDYAYHGDTWGAMSVSGISLFNEVFSSLFLPAYRISSPYCYRCPFEEAYPACKIKCITPLERILREKKDEICAFIIEPLVLAAGGMIIYPGEYLEKARELTKEYNVHLILDEVATGFGRTGKMFAYHHTKVLPDFICLSKGLTAGYLPLGATLTTKEVYNAFYADYKEKKTFYHGHTFTGNPLSCAVAYESLRIFDEEKTLEKINNLSHLFHRELEKFRNLPLVGDVRYIGMVGALELVKDKATKEFFSLEERIGLKVYQQGLKENLLLRPLGNIIYFFLPFCIKESEIKVILKKTYRIIEKLSLTRGN